MIGTELAHYRVTAKIGEGGMGEVWRATDSKLDREVALKVLHADVAQDPDRIARFEREADVLAVSGGGEMALALDRRFVSGWETAGTLATASLTGSAPRSLLEGVGEADWGPDGKSMAVVREVSGRYRLEYPIGTVLFETDGWLSELRVRPSGDLVAFVDHPLRGDNLGRVTIVDLEGKATVLQRGGSQGLAWSPSGDEVWSSSGRRLVALSLDGERRTVYTGTDPMWLEDISPDGRVLISSAGIRREMAGLEEDEIPVQWTGDSSELYGYRPGELPARVWRVDPASGERTFWGEIAPSDPAGVFGIDYLAISPDGEGYVYSYRRLLSTLYLFEGLE